MQRAVRNRLVLSVSMLAILMTAVGVSGDVVVKPDELQLGDLKISEDTYNDATIASAGEFAIHISGSPWAALTIEDASWGSDLEFGGDVLVDGLIYTWDNVVAFGDMACNGDMIAADMTVGNDMHCYGNMTVGGKLTAYGGIDPPYILYDLQSRNEIVERVKKEVPLDKMGGAALFFNAENKRLEIYVASEGKFYDLQGNCVHKLSKAEAPGTEYEKEYYIEPSTGLVKVHQKAIMYKCKVQDGFELDKKTGRFLNIKTGKEASREDALEWCIGNDNIYRDMKGNVLRSEPSDEQIKYIEGYRFDRRTGNVKLVKKAVYDRYAIRSGYEVDEATGKYVSSKTGQIVNKDEAVELIEASDMVQRFQNQSNQMLQ